MTYLNDHEQIKDFIEEEMKAWDTSRGPTFQHYPKQISNGKGLIQTSSNQEGCCWFSLDSIFDPSTSFNYCLPIDPTLIRSVLAGVRKRMGVDLKETEATIEKKPPILHKPTPEKPYHWIEYR